MMKCGGSLAADVITSCVRVGLSPHTIALATDVQHRGVMEQAVEGGE